MRFPLPHVDGPDSTMHAGKYLAALSPEEQFKAMQAYQAMRGLDPHEARTKAIAADIFSIHGIGSRGPSQTVSNVWIVELYNDTRSFYGESDELSETNEAVQFSQAVLRAAFAAGIELNGKPLTEADL